MCPYIDNVLELKHDYLHKYGDKYEQQIESEIDFCKYDAVFNMRGRDGNISYKEIDSAGHAVDYFTRQVFGDDYQLQKRQAWLTTSEIDDERAQTILQNGFNHDNDIKTIGVIPYCGFGIGQRTKTRWSVGNFEMVMKALSQQIKCRFVVFGTKSDLPIGVDNTINCVGNNVQDLATVAALIKRCDLIIGVDTGTIHMASAFDTPITCVMYPTYPEHWKPLRDIDVITFGAFKGFSRITNVGDLKTGRVVMASIELLQDNKNIKSKTYRIFPNIRNIFRLNLMI